MKNLKRIKEENYKKVLPINELYTAVQGEGSRAGYPTVVVRVTGCTHRCCFGAGGWCDSWYSSIHPEPGKFSFQEIIDIFNENPQITDLMLTGGSPTLHPTIVNELTHFCKGRGIFLTMETEGSFFLETDFPIDLLSISPKFSNSVPPIGAETPLGQIVDENFIKIHNTYRKNVEVIKDMINYHTDFHVKPVIDKDLTILPEVEKFLEEARIPKYKVWLMPAGDTREALQESYGPVMNLARDKGYRFTGRPHIIAFNKDRYV